MKSDPKQEKLGHKAKEAQRLERLKLNLAIEKHLPGKISANPRKSVRDYYIAVEMLRQEMAQKK